MKWQAIITKKQRIRSVCAVLFSPKEALLITTVFLTILVLQQFATGIARKALLVELALAVAIVPLMIFRALWQRARMIRMTGSEIMRYEIKNGLLRFSAGKDSIELPTESLVIWQTYSQMILLKRKGLRVGNQLVLYFDEESTKAKALIVLKKEGVTHARRTKAWTV
jgi:hypothetical protein